MKFQLHGQEHPIKEVGIANYIMSSVDFGIMPTRRDKTPLSLGVPPFLVFAISSKFLARITAHSVCLYCRRHHRQ
ncbi:hypothetical protein ACLOJK_031867 [Asimina triloba]